MPDDIKDPEGTSAEAQAVEEASQSEEGARNLSDEERAKALEWFLGDPPPEGSTSTIKLNVATDPALPKEWIQWTVRALPRERITEIRNEEAEGDIPAGKGNLVIATEGTKYPNLRQNAGKFADPSDALATRFSFKPGLIDQIASRVIACSGYDEEDVKELSAVKT